MIAFHPLANVFPLVEGAGFVEFVDNVREHGLADEIVTHEDKILDGRNRYRALVKIGLTDEEILRCHTEPLDDGVGPLTLVISKNLKRRDLDDSQRAMVAARLATLRDGQRKPLSFRSPAAEPMEERAHHQRDRAAARGVQTEDQDADCAAVGRYSGHVVLGAACFRPDQHAQGRWSAKSGHKAHRSAN
jgi:ParB-like chromosome segregation protein Spo0J